MTYVLIGIFIYLVIGVVRVVADFAQPVYNQPDYVRHPTLLMTLLVVVLWPVNLLLR